MIGIGLTINLIGTYEVFCSLHWINVAIHVESLYGPDFYVVQYKISLG